MRLTLRIIVVVVVAIMHSAIFACNETAVLVPMVRTKHLHWVDVVSCNAWYTSLLEKSRRRGVLLAKALSMAKRHVEGAKPEVPWTACNAHHAASPRSTERNTI
jgi:hypothetical protein